MLVMVYLFENCKFIESSLVLGHRAMKSDGLFHSNFVHKDERKNTILPIQKLHVHVGSFTYSETACPWTQGMKTILTHSETACPCNNSELKTQQF